MFVFVSFASEQSNLAESLVISLRGQGHTVFFSDDSLPVAKTFDERLEKAVEQSDLMIFLVSPEAVAPGRYTLTELKFARKKWPNPSGRVLPVLIAPTSRDSIPAYLSAVTI